jgi:glycosidase
MTTRFLTRPWCDHGFLPPGFDMSINSTRLLEFLGEMKREVLTQSDCISVGETPGATPEMALAVTDQEQGALDMLFQFDHVNSHSVPGRSKWVRVAAAKLAVLRPFEAFRCWHQHSVEKQHQL